jgi:hypothetical protein
MSKIWVAALAVGSGLMADSVTSATGSFSAFPFAMSASTPAWISGATPTSTFGNTGTVFWNNPSDDVGTNGSHMMNVGYVLTDTGGLAGTPAVLGTETVAEQFTGVNGTDPSAFNFVRSATSYDITLLFADSSLDTGNSAVGTVFGYYVGDVFTQIYTVGLTSSPTGTEAFDPTPAGNAYGFYATVCYSPGVCETYTTGEGNFGNDSAAAAWNHFALFQLSDGNYAMGFTAQNGWFGEDWGDFNDVVVELSAVNPTPSGAVPEPGTMLMMGSALLGLGMLAGRRRRL